MRRFDEVARFWNDTRSRLPQSAWSWPLVAASVGVLFMAITGSSGVPIEARSNAATTPVAWHDACQGQTWPYLSDACLRRGHAAPDQPAVQTPVQTQQVRVLNYEPGMAAAAVGATPWAPKATAVSRTPQAPQKRGVKRQTPHNLDNSRAVTVRSGRRGRDARERVYVVPSESAYRAYGYAPR